MVRSQFLLGLKGPEDSPARRSLAGCSEFECSLGSDLALMSDRVIAFGHLDFDRWGNSCVLV